MVKKLLVTTALEETWRTDMHIVFLGDWCCLYDSKAIWEEFDYSDIPYHWDDREFFYNDDNYIRGSVD